MTEKEWIKAYRKDRELTLNRILTEWGRDIYTADGKCNRVDAVIATWTGIAKAITAIEHAPGYRLSEHWLKEVIAQTVPHEAYARMFWQYGWDMGAALNPKSINGESVIRIDFSDH